MDSTAPTRALFAIVHDVAGSWHDYQRVRELTEHDTTCGLLVHAAGPTHEGFRTMNLWGSDDLWQAQQHRFDRAVSSLPIAPVARQFHVRHFVICVPGGDRYTSTQETQP